MSTIKLLTGRAELANATLRKASFDMHIPWSQYAAILEVLPIACVDVVILRKGAALLVQRGDAPAQGEWWVPGGRILKGETILQAALRKAREEVGLDCNVGTIIHTEDTIFSDGPGGIGTHSINVCVLLLPKDETAEVHLDAHSRAFAWFSHVPRRLHPYVTGCLIRAGLRFEDADQ